MKQLLYKIQEAKTWKDYYDAYKRAYSYILNDLWALGKMGFAQQLHHTAVPDVTGAIVDSVNWAAYSQPSHETLEKFLPVFSESLRAEPQRIRSSRYFFFVTYGVPIETSMVQRAFGDLCKQVDFWCGSFEDILSAGNLYSTAIGLGALLSTGKWCPPIDRTTNTLSGNDAIVFLQDIHETINKQISISHSIIPRQIIIPLANSFIILMGFRMNVSVESLITIIGDSVGIATCIALDRVKASGWQKESINYCEQIFSLKPPKTNDYIVQPGDILSRVVRQRYEMAFYQLWPLIRVLNPQIKDPNRIFPEQRIHLPVLQ
jgi:hypothetical protein